MQNYIKANSIGEAWLLSLNQVLRNGIKINDKSDEIIEITPFFIEINNPVLPDPIIEKYGDKIYLDFLSKNFQDFSPVPGWGYSYAQRLYFLNQTNQIESIIDKLTKNPLSKSATISLLDSKNDQKHIPCLTTLDFKIRDHNLIITATFRSQDIGKKMYGDALELLKIGNTMLKSIPITTISLIHVISSAHIYLKDIQKIKAILEKVG